MRRALSVIGFNDSEVEVRMFSSTDLPTSKDFSALIWDFWFKSVTSFRVNVFPTKILKEDTECSPKMWINTKPLLCSFHHPDFCLLLPARICWALWPVFCTWGMYSLLLMSRGMLRSLQRIRLNTWPGWVSPVREIQQERWTVEDSLLWA